MAPSTHLAFVLAVVGHAVTSSQHCIWKHTIDHADAHSSFCDFSNTTPPLLSMHARNSGLCVGSGCVTSLAIRRAGPEVL